MDPSLLMGWVPATRNGCLFSSAFSPLHLPYAAPSAHAGFLRVLDMLCLLIQTLSPPISTLLYTLGRLVPLGVTSTGLCCEFQFGSQWEALVGDWKV